MKTIKTTICRGYQKADILQQAQQQEVSLVVAGDLVVEVDSAVAALVAACRVAEELRGGGDMGSGLRVRGFTCSGFACC